MIEKRQRIGIDSADPDLYPQIETVAQIYILIYIGNNIEIYIDLDIYTEINLVNIEFAKKYQF